MSGVDRGAVPDGDFAQELSEMARRLQAEDDTERMLNQLVVAAVALIPGADDGSISVVVARREVTSQSPTGDLPDASIGCKLRRVRVHA